MNHFERARTEAIKVRSQLLGARAGEGVHAKELLGKVEEVLKLAIERVTPRFSQLGNGDAVLKRDEQFIYVRDDVEDDMHAYLASHEVGHWFLDAGKATIKIATLAALKEGRGTPGVIFVEAYGARERDELQANVFARELLLPRDVAAKLFAEGLGPAAMAKKLGIPLEVCRQQTLDAVLLPVGAPQEPKKLHDMKPDQRKAAHAPERFVNVVAGPGTGKTSTLIHRVKHLIEEKGVDPAHILVLTFTNKAAAELVERLHALNVSNVSRLWVGTFHSFGLEFLRKFHNRFGLEDDVKVADTLGSITLLNKRLPRLKLRHFLRVDDPYYWLGDALWAIKRLKEELVTPAEYRKRIAALEPPDPQTAALREDVATLYEAYELGLKEEGLVDFVDLIGKPATAIRDDRATYTELADTFQHVLVDEYQDVTFAMVELVRQLARNAKSLWVVGDIRQAIHHWRGASFRSLMHFEAQYRSHARDGEIQKYPLVTNYRCSPEILDVVTLVGTQHALQRDLPFEKMEAVSKPAGEKPFLVSCQDGANMLDAIAKGVRKAKSAGHAYNQQAVLCRKTEHVEAVAEHLHQEGIPALYLGELPQRPEVKPILCLMQLRSERSPKALLGLVGIPDLMLPAADFDVVMEYVAKNPRKQRGRWLEDDIPGLSEPSRKAVGNIAALLEGRTRESKAWSFVCDLILERRLSLPPPGDGSLRAQVARLALWQFAYSVRAGDGMKRGASLTRYLLQMQLRQRLGDTPNDKELPPEASVLDAVRVSTIHVSKGLEFDAVHLGFVDDASFGAEQRGFDPTEKKRRMVPPEVVGSTTDAFKHEQAIERNNLLYVAVSRPRKVLFMHERGDYQGNRPPQLDRDPPPYDVLDYYDEVTQGSAAAKAPLPAHDGPALTFQEFDTYLQCPLRHWYRFRRGLPSEQDMDVSVRARLAIMEALRAHASGASPKPSAALAERWNEVRLPTPDEDVSLWDDANTVLTAGLDKLRSIGGTYQEVVTDIAGVPIGFPWGMAAKENGQLHLHVLHFAPYVSKTQAKLLRPMLNAKGNDAKVTFHPILASVGIEFKKSGRITSTHAWAAAEKLRAGDRQPQRGDHCKTCPYVTICPNTPA